MVNHLVNHWPIARSPDRRLKLKLTPSVKVKVNLTLTELHCPVNQMVNVVRTWWRSICSSHSIILITFFSTSERKLLQVANLFETYDETTFQECYWVLTVKEQHEMLDGWSERKTTLVYKIHFVSFISSFTMMWKWRTALISLALSPMGVCKTA